MMHAQAPATLWFRQDLRLADNPALAAAIDSGRPVIPLYVLQESDTSDWPLGGASRWWLHHSLSHLDQALRQRGARLVLRRGDPANVLAALLKQQNGGAVYWNRCYEPDAIVRDKIIKARLEKDGIGAESFNSSLLFEPWTIAPQNGGYFKVYSPFWRACLRAKEPSRPRGAPNAIPFPDQPPQGETLDSWGLLPRRPNWAAGFERHWRPGEDGARNRIETFLNEAIDGYQNGRDRPDRAATSCLSPHLHWGEISPRQVWHAVHHRTVQAPRLSKNTEKFISELGWREFSYHLLYHFPELPSQNFQDNFDGFPWADSPAKLQAWRKGQTGYPIVDAGMRELWATGWMHNRVRMIAASFLIKDLLVDWREGARWFWDTLVDADLANNSASWQWVAGCGADATPYFRIFNPVVQGEKFDPEGAYVRQWVPELRGLNDRFIHKPWEAPEPQLAVAKVRLGDTYPRPIVDHAAARKRALAAFDKIRS